MKTVDVFIVVIILTVLFFAIRRIINKKGKCDSCNHADTCPIKKIIKK